MREFNLFSDLPEPSEKLVSPNIRTIKNRIIASERGKEFYDGDRNNGYGGYKNDGRWRPVAQKIIEEYNLEGGSILHIGCDYGFLLSAIKRQYKRITVTGTETSEYAFIRIPEHISKDIISITPYEMDHFGTNSYDLVIAAGPVYAANLPDAIEILRQINRISRKHSFITLGAFETEEEERLFRQWTLLGTTILSKSDWIEVLNYVEYTGDYWFSTAQTLNLVHA